MRTTEYYCIPPFQWEKLHYDLLTREDHGCDPIPDPMLARVRRLQETGTRKSFDFYRIELNDPSILTAATREKLLDAPDLYSFLVYILTHEMVHLVRLSTILNNNPEPIVPGNKEEELRVQDVAHRILSDYAHLLPILNKFCTPESETTHATIRSAAPQPSAKRCL